MGPPRPGAWGLEVEVLDRLGYRAFTDLPETRSLGQGSEILSARDHFAAHLVAVGYFGDTMWDRAPQRISGEMAWRLAGHIVTELRLERGFVLFPVPFIASRQQPDVVRISQSAEMAPWALGNDYDRPICRRIAETRGVPRESFGMRKRAAGVFYRDEGLAQTMAPESYADYLSYRQRELGTSAAVARLADRGANQLRTANRLINRIESRLLRRIAPGRTLARFPVRPGTWSEAALLVPWATERMAERYRLGGSEGA